MLTVLYNCNRLQSLRATYCAWVPHQVKTTQYSSFIISIIIIQCNLVKVLHQARDHDLLLPTPNIYIYYEKYILHPNSGYTVKFQINKFPAYQIHLNKTNM